MVESGPDHFLEHFHHNLSESVELLDVVNVEAELDGDDNDSWKLRFDSDDEVLLLY